MRIRQRIQRTRKYRSLFVAVEVGTGRIWYCWLASMKGEEFCGVVRGIEQAGILDALVWDGAPGHRDERVGRIGVPLIALPPYSPELNPCEQLWDILKDDTCNRVHATVGALRNAMGATLRRYWEDAAAVLRLIGRDWFLAELNATRKSQVSV